MKYGWSRFGVKKTFLMNVCYVQNLVISLSEFANIFLKINSFLKLQVPESI
jgi:hypothetical protein